MNPFLDGFVSEMEKLARVKSPVGDVQHVATRLIQRSQLAKHLDTDMQPAVLRKALKAAGPVTDPVTGQPTPMTGFEKALRSVSGDKEIPHRGDLYVPFNVSGQKKYLILESRKKKNGGGHFMKTVLGEPYVKGKPYGSGSMRPKPHVRNIYDFISPEEKNQLKRSMRETLDSEIGAGWGSNRARAKKKK
jgi:hypothetical protein